MSTSTNPIPDRTGNDNPKDCVKFWEEELEKVSNALQTAESKTNDAQKVFANLSTWEAALKTYWENIEKTAKLSENITVELDLFMRYLCGKDAEEGEHYLCEFTECTVEVTKMLFCLVKDFFECTDQLKEKLTDLNTRIDCLNAPDINPKTSKIYGCLKDLSAKLDAAIAAQQATIKKVLEVVKYAHVLNEILCGNDPKNCSLCRLLEELHGLFTGTGSASSDPDQRAPYGTGCGARLGESCDAEITPKPELPFKEGSQDSYYRTTERQYQEARAEKAAAETKYNDARRERDALVAAKKSLENAKQAAETAKNCK